jgi:hypothetical protein
MLDRREFAASTLAMCAVGPAVAAAPQVWDRSLLKEAWAITDGKDEAGMYEALTQRFGSFPIMFRGLYPGGREVEVGIFGVYQYPPDFDRRGYPRRGWAVCDVRILPDEPWPRRRREINAKSIRTGAHEAYEIRLLSTACELIYERE